jgi:hypothetical protein
VCFEWDMPELVPASEKSINLPVDILDAMIVQVFYENKLNGLLYEVGKTQRRSMFFQYLEGFIEFTMMMINNIHNFNHNEIH